MYDDRILKALDKDVIAQVRRDLGNESAEETGR